MVYEYVSSSHVGGFSELKKSINMNDSPLEYADIYLRQIIYDYCI